MKGFDFDTFFQPHPIISYTNGLIIVSLLLIIFWGVYKLETLREQKKIKDELDRIDDSF